MLRQVLTIASVVALGAVPLAARADIYEYMDAGGTAHFTNVPVDARYKLILRTAVDVSAGRTVDAKRLATCLARSSAYDGAIDRAARDATVQPELVRAVIVVESGFNPLAISRRGAVGLMQLLPATARRYGAFNAFDPEQNIRAGAYYLAALIGRYGANLELALAAYNAGESAVDHYGGHIPPYRETRAYVPSVLKVYRALQAQG